MGWLARLRGEGHDSPISLAPAQPCTNTAICGQHTVYTASLMEALPVTTAFYKGYPTHVGENGRMLDWEELSPHQLALAACGSHVKARVVQGWIAEQQLEASIEPQTADYEALQTTKLVLANLVALEQPELGT